MKPRPITVFIVADEDGSGLRTGLFFADERSAQDYVLDEGGRVFVVSGLLDLDGADDVTDEEVEW